MIDPTADVNLLRYSLYKVVENNAKPLTGAQVIRALKGISEEMYDAGVDDALRWTEREMQSWDNIASAWDLTWLTLLAVRLRMMQSKKKRR